MPSRLQHQLTIDTVSAEATRSYFPSPRSSSQQPPAKKQKMSLSQTYFVASSARAKLGREASRADHNLRLLVGHANLLDALMLELADAEREQERWFNQTVQKAQKASDEKPAHIRWADTIVEEDSDDEDADSDSDSDSEYDEAEFEMATTSLRRLKSPPVAVASRPTAADDEEDYYSDDDVDMPELALTRTNSQQLSFSQQQSLPELVDDSDSDDDSSPPASPPQPSMDFDDAFDATEGKGAGLSASEQAAFLEDGFFIPDRPAAPLIAIQA